MAKPHYFVAIALRAIASPWIGALRTLQSALAGPLRVPSNFASKTSLLGSFANISIAFSYDDEVAGAKVVCEAAEKTKKLSVKFV